MRVFLIILCTLLLKQSFATCSIGPMFHNDHHQTTTSHSLSQVNSDLGKKCCKKESKTCTSDDKNHKKHSKDDGCGDDCHCACCAKVLISNFYTYKPLIIAIDFINEEKTSLRNLYSYEYIYNIVHPPVA